MGETANVTEFVVGALGEPEVPESPKDEALPPQPESSDSPVQKSAEKTIEQTGADPPPCKNLEVEIQALKLQRIALCKRIHSLEEWVDTFSSPLYKRVFWWFQGYRWKTVGRWR